MAQPIDPVCGVRGAPRGRLRTAWRWVRGSRGVSLVEATVALTIFSVGALAVLSAVSLGFAQAGSAKQHSLALDIARTQIESIKLQDYVEPPASYATVASDDFDIAISGVVKSTGYLEEITVTVTHPSGQVELSAYKVNHFPPVLAATAVAAEEPACPVGKVCKTYYLHNNPSPPIADTNAQANLPMNETSQIAYTRFNYDANRDSDVGLTIKKGGSATTADLTKYQNWRSATLSSDMHISGDVELQLWTAIRNFQAAKASDMTVYLRDFDGASTYTTIGSATLSLADWQGGFSDFVVYSFSMTGLDYTVPSGHLLDLRAFVPSSGQPEMWVMYDFVDFDSKLFLQTV